MQRMRCPEKVKEIKTYDEHFQVNHEKLSNPKDVNVALMDSAKRSEFKYINYAAAFEALQGKDINIRALRAMFNYNICI